MSLTHEEKRKFGAKQKIEKLIFVAKKNLRRKFEKKNYIFVFFVFILLPRKNKDPQNVDDNSFYFCSTDAQNKYPIVCP
jgi:hypothetical protein